MDELLVDLTRRLTTCLARDTCSTLPRNTSSTSEPLLIRVNGSLRGDGLRLASRFAGPAGSPRTPVTSPAARRWHGPSPRLPRGVG